MNPYIAFSQMEEIYQRVPIQEIFKLQLQAVLSTCVPHVKLQLAAIS